ncbi:hypothetical protein FRC09_014902 [Ceratobasidium sp. 395]|nr:hypothetical protein FRC09_014902 [Ceratobasidium sp. 395]
MERIVDVLRAGLQMQTNLSADELMISVEQLTAFQIALQEYGYETSPINSLTSMMFERYTVTLDKDYRTQFIDVGTAILCVRPKFAADDTPSFIAPDSTTQNKAVNDDDNIPIDVSNREEAQKQQLLATCFVTSAERDAIFRQSFPFSRIVHKVSLLIKDYAHQFYQFVEGVSQPPRNVDQILEKSLGELLTKCVADTMTAKLGATTALGQVAQMLVNVEYLRDGCAEVDRYLTSLRAGHRGHTFHISAADALGRTLQRAESRISAVIAKKLDDFEPEYDWTTRTTETQASIYIFQLVSWLTTVVDSLDLEDRFKDVAYRNAMIHVSNLFMKKKALIGFGFLIM